MINNIWDRLVLIGLLLMLILAPFAGFAPLLLILIIAALYWFSSSILQILLLGKTIEDSNEQEK